VATPSPTPPPPHTGGGHNEPSDAILTVPNLITFLRLALIPVFMWLAIGPEQVGAAVAVGFVAGASDFVDGRVARRYNQVSKLGIALDPLSDRFLIAAAAAILIIQDMAPLWVVAVVLARDALLLAAVPLLSARGVPRPAVSWFGKAGTFGIMWGLGMFLAAHIVVPPARWLQIVAWLFVIPGMIFAYIAAGGYARTTIAALRANSTDARPRVQ